MTAVAALHGRQQIAELLRMAVRRLAAQPFEEMASIDGYAQLQRAHEDVCSALRALGEDPDQPSHEECDEDRPASVLSPLERAVRHVRHSNGCTCLAERRWCCDPECCPPLAPPTAPPVQDVQVVQVLNGLPPYGTASSGPAPRWFRAGLPVAAPAVEDPADRPIECISCGTVFAEGSLVASRDAYAGHLTNGRCRPDRPTGWTWAEPMTLAQTSAGCGRKR